MPDDPPAGMLLLTSILHRKGLNSTCYDRNLALEAGQVLITDLEVCHVGIVEIEREYSEARMSNE